MRMSVFLRGGRRHGRGEDRVEREREEASTVQIFVPEGAENQESERRQTFLDCTIRVQAIHRPSGETRGFIRFPESWVNCCEAPPARGTENNCRPSPASAL